MGIPHKFCSWLCTSTRPECSRPGPLRHEHWRSGVQVSEAVWACVSRICWFAFCSYSRRIWTGAQAASVCSAVPNGTCASAGDFEMATELKVKLTTKVLAVVTSVAAAYPFYAIVDKLSKPDLDTFVPCNDRPCYFQRLFTGGGMPGTAPDVLAVQNGIARPLVMNDEFQAVSVEYQRVKARILPHTVATGFGYNEYVWPCVQENCTAHIVQVRQWCAYWICVDDDFSVSLGFTLGTWENYWLRKSSRIDFAMRMIHQFRSNHSSTHSAPGLQTERILWSSNVLQTLYRVFAAMVNFYGAIVLALAGESNVSGSEMLTDSLCPDMTPQEMIALCASKDMKNAIISDISEGICARVYTLCIVLWVLVKSVHDMMLLNGCSEEHSLLCGLLSIPVQAGAALAACFLAIGACEVFIAPVPDQPCQCYYQMSDVNAMLFLATPCLLIWIYRSKARTIDLSLLVGDVLYYRSFDIPFRFVKKHDTWSDNGLMQPTVYGNKAEEEPPEASSNIPRFHLLVRCRIFFEIICSYLCFTCAFQLVWGIFFSKFMMFLTKNAMKSSPPGLLRPDAWLMCVCQVCVPGEPYFIRYQLGPTAASPYLLP